MNINLNIDSNRRSDFILHNTETIQNETTQRIITIALPFLNLNATTGKIASVGMGVYQTYTSVTNREWGRLVLTVTTTAYAIFFPLGQLVISNVSQLAVILYDFSTHVRMGLWKESGVDLFKLTHQVIYIFSIFYGTPEAIAFSLLAQAGAEIYQAYQEKRAPEAFAFLILASLRLYQSTSHLQTLKRNYFGADLNQQQWERLYYDIRFSRLIGDPKKGVDIESLLIEKGISSHIHDIKFNETTELTDFVFKNLRFKNCNFNDTNFEGSSFHHVLAHSCQFKNALWINSVIQNCFFSHSVFTDAAAVHSYIKETVFFNSDMSLFCFNDSFLSHFFAIRSTLCETSFLNATVQKGFLIDSNLTDCLLLDTKDNFTIIGKSRPIVTRPIIGISWNFRNHGWLTPLTVDSLRKNGSIPLRYERIPVDINPNLLDREVKEIIASIQTKRPTGMMSIPDELLKTAKDGFEIGKIRLKTAHIFKHCQGVCLPGFNNDIAPEFYGAQKEEGTDPDPDYRHLLTEFAMVSLADQNKVPTLGLCRGSQIINVYFGGTLKQDVPHQRDVFQLLNFTDSSHKEWLKDVIGENFIGYSCHHQASDKIGKNLEVVLDFGPIPKLLVSRDRTFIASQFHPEIYSLLKQKQEKAFKPSERLSEAFELYSDIIEKNQNLYRYFVKKAFSKR